MPTPSAFQMASIPLSIALFCFKSKAASLSPKQTNAANLCINFPIFPENRSEVLNSSLIFVNALECTQISVFFMDFCISLNRKSPIIDVSTVTPGWKLIRVELWNQNTNSGCPTLSLRRKIILNKSRSGKSDHLFTQPAKKENLSGRI